MTCRMIGAGNKADNAPRVGSNPTAPKFQRTVKQTKRGEMPTTKRMAELETALADLVAAADLVTKEARAKIAAGVIQDHIFHTKITDLADAADSGRNALK